jgi:sodium/bile acid cotransporter 7
VRYKLTKLGSFALLTVVWQTYDSAFASGAFSSIAGTNMLFLVFLAVGLFLLFLCLSFFAAGLWLPRADVVSVCYCAPAKSPAMGVPLAMTMFVGLSPVLEAKLQIPMVIYQGLQIAGGTVFVPLFRSWVRRGEKLVVSEEMDGP